MKSHTLLLLLNVILAALMFRCGTAEQPPNGPPASPTPTPVAALAPARLPVPTGKEVTFYPTFGYKDANGWTLLIRGWVHEDGRIAATLLDRIKECGEQQKAIFRARTTDFLDESKTFERVIIKFDSDPEDKPYDLIKSRSNGIVTIDLLLSDEKAKQLLEKQGSINGWLTYRAVSDKHTGLGRVRLIEPGGGESLVSDIDDTIKITEVPGAKDVVLRNTFCLEFKPVVEPDMAKMYRDRGGIPVHYISGGPEQMFGPLYDYLITGAGGFPEGTFHLKFFPTPRSVEGLRTLIDTVKSSMTVTRAHKVEKIKWLMDKFPDRQFTLIGDSGEVDPEVYNEIRKWRPQQVKEIAIRDVINDEVLNPFRLAGMTIIKVAQPVCVDAKHFDHLKDQVKKSYPTETYQRNTSPPCAPATAENAGK